MSHKKRKEEPISIHEIEINFTPQKRCYRIYGTTFQHIFNHLKMPSVDLKIYRINDIFNFLKTSLIYAMIQTPGSF